ncbi:hypothetical protein DFH09DRAFT_1366946 [Mycena vulgaris]|nr:hypothetical protein DFH09DRAFT_1366946 [Mycena vulgaris]
MTSPDHWVISALILPGVGLTFIVLALYAYAAWNPVSRKHLDRVSFRLLVYALLANLIFGILFPVGMLDVHPGWQCGFVSFLVSLSLLFSAGMFFCIGINLPLVLHHNVNGQRMENYYIIGTAVVSGVCNIVPYASGHLGWDTINHTCRYRSFDEASRMGWFIGTQTVWILLVTFGEVVAFLIMVRHLVAYLATRGRFREARKLSATYSSGASLSNINTFRNIIIRIGLYPLVSCLLNISTSALELYIFDNPVQRDLNSRLNLMDLALFSARPLTYGLLAATDPSFIRALRELYSRSKKSSDLDLDLSTRRPTPCFTTILDMAVDGRFTGTEYGKQEMRKSLELGQTLNVDISGHGGNASDSTLPNHRTSEMDDVVCHI